MLITEIHSDEIFNKLDFQNCYSFVVTTMSGATSFIYIYDRITRVRSIIGYNHPDLHNSGKDPWHNKLQHDTIQYTSTDALSLFNIWSYVIAGEIPNVNMYIRELLFNRYIRGNDTDIFAIPIVKWVALFDQMVSNTTQLEIMSEDLLAYKSYVDIVCPAIRYLNSQPITVNSEVFGRITGIKTGTIRSNYKPYTSTGRPTNVNGVNLLSMPRNSELRESIISTYSGGSLIEYDYKSFHITLLANYLDVTLGGGDVYDTLGKLYGNSITRTMSKRLSIKYLYSDDENDIPPDHELFNKVKQLRAILYDQYITNGYIRSPLFSRRMYIPDGKVVTSGKILAYFMQSYESELNFTTICEISEYLLLKKSRLILYTYDSFLFDYHPDDGKGILRDMQNIFERVQCSTSISAGLDYKDMFKIELD